jgi:hypothetical protein
MGKNEWDILFSWMDLEKRAESDVQAINSRINDLQRSSMSIDRKRRKGRILKEIRRNINWAMEKFYDRRTIREAIKTIGPDRSKINVSSANEMRKIIMEEMR